MSEARRKANVFYKGRLAGVLTETADGYVFQYDRKFLEEHISISLSLPAREAPYESRELFAFFRGLLPEGWYLDIVGATQKIDTKDAFGVLLSTAGTDTIGAVTVRQAE